MMGGDNFSTSGKRRTTSLSFSKGINFGLEMENHIFSVRVHRFSWDVGFPSVWICVNMGICNPKIIQKKQIK